jgi:hypothetical protein
MNPPDQPTRHQQQGLLGPAAVADAVRREIEAYEAMKDNGLVTPDEYEKIRVNIVQSSEGDRPRQLQQGLLMATAGPDAVRREIEEYKRMMEEGLIRPEEYERKRLTSLKGTGLLD